MKAATSPSSSSLYSTYHCRTVSDDTNERYKRTLQSINLESLNIEKIKTAKDMIRDSLELFYLPQDKLTFTNSITHKIELRWL